MSVTRYREIEVSGTPRELGRAIGEAARDEVRGFCEVALARVQRSAPSVTRAQALRVVKECTPLIEDYSPELLEELRGVAESAAVGLDDLLLLQIRNQLQAEADAGCTSAALIPDPTTGACVVGQNWDNDPELDAFTVVLTRRPEGQPALMTVTQAGLIAYIGLNDRGLGACLNTLPAPSRQRGVPHYFQLRKLYEADSLEAAVTAIRRAERAIPANIMLATPEGPADLEVTLDNVHVLSDPQRVTHTNHCQHPELQPINADFPELIQSHPRKQRIDALLDSAAPAGVAALQSALRDHDNHPRSICRHANEDQQTGFWQTVFSVVIEPQERQMYVTRGTPCDHPYERYRMDA